MRQMYRATLFALVAACLLVAAAYADSDDDHERARRAFEAGEIVSLSSIIDRIERDFEGELLEVELEDEGGSGLVYEVKLLAPGGRIVELLFDAGNGELLREGGEGHERGDRAGHDEDEDHD